MKRRPHIIVLAVALFSASGAQAGSQAGSKPRFPQDQIAAFAKKVERDVAARGARVFIISRLGRPAEDLPEGVRYTHVAFGVYSAITTEDGRQVPGYVIYNLYSDSNQRDRSALVTDFPVNFFAAAAELRTEVIIPSPELQIRLLAVIASDTYAALHNPSYSAVSNPFTSEHQNCTEHTLDVINAAVYRTDDVVWLKNNSKSFFEPQEISLNPVAMMFGQMMSEDITFEDHEGPVRTATFSTIARYMERYKLIQEQFTVSHAID